VLALASAAAINLGFLLQHRGLAEIQSIPRRPWDAVRVGLKSHSWLGGQALGWVGFAAQIVAVSLAPLSLVQAFAAAGLALSVPLAALLFAHRISHSQRLAVVLVAAGLAVLPLGLGAGGEHLRTGTLTVVLSATGTVAVLVVMLRRPALLAIAAGLFYGIADAAIKAISLGFSQHHAAALLSGWTVVALLGTAAGFLAFQRALRTGNAVSSISLMTALAALVAIGCGVLAFGETLGRRPAITVVHLCFVGVILACLPVLALAHHEIAESTGVRRRRTGLTALGVSLAGQDQSWQAAAHDQEQSLEPWTKAGRTGPQYVAEPQVSRQGK
jgi:uncharacterized membrane protein